MAKKYYWLKLKTDFFKSIPMKKLRRIAGGDTYTIIYLKLQLLSIKDEGILYYQGYESTFYEEMALALDEDVENVRATLIYLESVGLLQQKSENEYALTEVPFLIGSETDKAELMRKKRAKDKLIGIENSNNVTAQLPDVPNRYTEKEKEKEIDIDIEIEKETEIEKREKINYQKIVDMYNDTCVSLPRVQSLSDARKKAIKARLKVYSIYDLQRVFEKAEASTFLKGGNSRNWNATFDWLLKDTNIAKVLDGNYDNSPSHNANTNNNNINRVAQQLDASYGMMADWAESED